MSQLAQELIDYIIDTLALDARSTGLWEGTHLLPCALTSRAFRPRATRHIFAHVRIGGTSPAARRQRIATLSALIRANPPLAACISELSLHALEPAPPSPFSPSSSSSSYAKDADADACPIPVHEKAFIELMQRITPLRALSLAVQSVRELEHPGPALHGFFLPFVAPFITELNLHRLARVPIEAVTHCTRLTSLGLSLVDFAECAQHAPCCSGSGSGRRRSGDTGVKLTHLTHRKSQNRLDTLPRLQAHLDLSHLKSFTAYTDDNSVEQIQAVLDLAADSLEELRLLSMDDTAWVALYHGTPSLARLTKLHTLHLHIPFCPLSIDMSRSVRLLLAVLRTVRPASLRTLVVEAKVGFMYVPVADAPEVLLKADWSEVAEEVRRVMVRDEGGDEMDESVCFPDVDRDVWDAGERMSLDDGGDNWTLCPSSGSSSSSKSISKSKSRRPRRSGLDWELETQRKRKGKLREEAHVSTFEFGITCRHLVSSPPKAAAHRSEPRYSGAGAQPDTTGTGKSASHHHHHAQEQDEGEEEETHMQRRCASVIAHLHAEHFHPISAVRGVRVVSPARARVVRYLDVDDDGDEGIGAMFAAIGALAV